MFGFFLGTTLFAGVAGLVLLVVLLRRLKVERHYKVLAFALLLFEIFNATAFAAILFIGSPGQDFFLRSLGYLFILLLPAGTSLAAPLIASKRNRILLQAAMLGAVLALVRVHAAPGLWHALVEPESGFVIALTAGGKFFFAIGVIGTAALLGKLEPLTQALEWRIGRCEGALNGVLLLLMLVLLVSCSISLIYGRLEHVFWLICQTFCGLFCLLLARALKVASKRQPALRPVAVSAPRVLSSNVLIYAGVYCLVFGVLMKLAMLLGGSWTLFVSFFTALGAVVLALVLLTENAWHQRWTRFVGRYWHAKKYDFRVELQHFGERISTADDQIAQAQALCAGLQNVFNASHCCLWIRREHEEVFAAFQCEGEGRFVMHDETLALSFKQMAWLERVSEGFAAAQLLQLAEPHGAGTKLLQDCVYLTALHVGPRVVGMLGLGPRGDGQTYDEEDRQLLELLANPASLALHMADLQQRVLASKQTESIYRIAAFIAHDLRHAVGALRLLAHNAKAHLDKPEFRADFLASLERVSQEMHVLMQRLSAVKTGGESTQFAACDAAQIIHETIADAQISPPIILELKIAALPQVWWDEEQIRVVLRNLLVNAREAMPQGGTLHIHAHSDAAHVRILIRDAGVGMSPEFVQHRLFRPNQTTKAKGLGIGLYQSREIVRAHRGEIYAASAIGKGASFEVVLPCRPNEKFIPAGPSTV